MKQSQRKVPHKIGLLRLHEVMMNTNASIFKSKVTGECRLETDPNRNGLLPLPALL